MPEASFRKYASKVKRLAEQHLAISKPFGRSSNINFKDYYQYLPLNKAAHEIRLLTLLPGPYSSAIQVLLHATSFTNDTPPNYEALSYVWGSTEYQAEIAVGASGEDKLPVTQNLEIALRHLRYEDEPRRLWIDAICVNQQDLDERSHQVQRMSDIFSKAKRVVVWLGPADDEICLAMVLLEEISSKIEVNWKLHSMRPVFRDGSKHDWGNVDVESPLDDYQWEALKAFFDRAWFERLWIWQEIRLTDQNTAIVQSGLNFILWRDMKDAIFCLSFQRMANRSIWEKLRQAYSIANMDSPTVLIDMAWQTRHTRCSDDRDRIYALLSLAWDTSSRITIIPDYTKPTNQVFQDVALEVLNNSTNMDMLTYCELKTKELDVPSWVPDWSNQSLASLFDMHKAASRTHSDGFYLGHGILSVKGVLQMKIGHVVSIHIPREYFNVAKVVRDLIPINVLDGQHIREGSMLDAYCRLLCDNRLSERFVPPRTEYPSFSASREVLRDLIGLRLDLYDLPSAAQKYLNFVRQALHGRTFLRTKDGHIGLGPPGAQENDQICVILGCSLPLILRPNSNGQYRIVGGCYVHGLMNGEALLGPLPTHYESIHRVEPTRGATFAAFVNRQTGQTQVQDPRLGPLPENWRLRFHQEENFWQWFYNSKTGEGQEYPTALDPRLTYQALRERGVDLIDIELV